MKELTLISSPNIKLADTATDIKFKVTDGDVSVDLTGKSLTFKIKNKTSYVKNITANVVENVVTIKSSDLDLPADEYYIELWASDDKGVSIYPDNNFVNLHINANATEIEAGGVISTITLDEFAKRIDEKLATIHDGEQGPVGPIGPVGPQGVPGFKKVYVNERGLSGVETDGTNLLTDTSLSVGDIVLDINVNDSDVLAQDSTQSAKLGDTVILGVLAQENGRNSVGMIANLTGRAGKDGSTSGLKVAFGDKFYVNGVPSGSIQELTDAKPYDVVLDVRISDQSLVEFTTIAECSVGDTAIFLNAPGLGFVPFVNLTPRPNAQKLADVLIKKGIISQDDLTDLSRSTLPIL